MTSDEFSRAEAQHLGVIKRAFALTSCLLMAACAPAATPASPTPVVSASITGAPSASPRAAQPLLRGQVVSMNADRDMVSFFADRGSLFARSTRDGPAPYLSKIQRAEPSSTWRTVFENDAAFFAEKVMSGRMALVEYRQEPLSAGAYDVTVVLIDLNSGQRTVIDHFALSAATFRGGGGAPRRAAGGLIALGPNKIAWTHLNELAGGNVEAVLRVASLTELARASVIGRSPQWIEPIAIDDRELVYVVGGTERDDLRARDLGTGRERSLTQLRAPSQSAGRDGPAIAGGWAGWIEYPPMAGAPDAQPGAPSTTTFRAVNLQTGVARERVLGAEYCHSLSANASYFVWDCGTRGATQQAFDPNAWKELDVLAVGSSGSAALAAADGGFIWYEAVADARRVTLLTTAP